MTRKSIRRVAWLAALALTSTLTIGAASAAAASPPVLTGKFRCVVTTGWCTGNATHGPKIRAYAQVTPPQLSSCMAIGCAAAPEATTIDGYRWDGYRWVKATIRTKNRWFIHEYTTGSYSIMRTYDTGVWVAVIAGHVNLWVPQRDISLRFAFRGCTDEPEAVGNANKMIRACYYGEVIELFTPTIR